MPGAGGRCEPLHRDEPRSRREHSDQGTRRSACSERPPRTCRALFHRSRGAVDSQLLGGPQEPDAPLMDQRRCTRRARRTPRCAGRRSFRRHRTRRHTRVGHSQRHDRRQSAVRPDREPRIPRRRLPPGTVPAAQGSRQRVARKAFSAPTALVPVRTGSQKDRNRRQARPVAVRSRIGATVRAPCSSDTRTASAVASTPRTQSGSASTMPARLWQDQHPRSAHNSKQTDAPLGDRVRAERHLGAPWIRRLGTRAP
jgi:hypothetical protein